ncbi:hypothetical protein BVRB_5g111580 [Beta vulgaris subsp. vulgaris]|nr:hypothetical protein BVRB_5g111580 [Beta vulgaris subsp. vulgaris]
MGQEVDKGEKEDVQEVSKEDNALERMGKNSNAELEMCTMEGNEGRQGHNPEAPGAEIVNEEISFSKTFFSLFPNYSISSSNLIFFLNL